MLGAILWAGGWVGIAYYFGRKFGGAVIEHSFFIGVAASVLLIIMIYRFFKKRKQE